MHLVPSRSAEPQPDQYRRLQRLPVELRQRSQWVLAAPGDKRPRTVSGHAASSTSPGTWTDFDTACAAAAEQGWQVGYVLTDNDPFACIDLDVNDGTPGEQVARFESVISTMDSYTERSRSGRGWHIWVRAHIGGGRKRDGVEVYSQERFIICTGDVVRDQPIADRQALVSNMVGQMEPPAPDILLTGEDEPNHELAGSARADGGILGRLFRGESIGDYKSQSEADLALVIMLLPRTSSPRECWATFRLSALGRRPKAARPDYMRRTLAVAAVRVAKEAEQQRHGAEVADMLLANMQAGPNLLVAGRHLRLLLDSDLDALPRLRWLVKGMIPDAGIGAIYGASGTFKSFLTLDLLAHISNGREWFGHRVKAAPAVYVPFEGQGGIPNRIRAWRTAQTAVRHPDRLATFEPDADVLSRVAVVMEPLNLREQPDRDRLVAGLKEQGWAGGVLCIDTLAHASAGIEENSSAMGEMISIFRDLQQRLGGVILLVHHSGKDESRGMRGWSGLHAAMDFVVECQKEGDGNARTASFRLAKVKDGTTGTTFAFQMQVMPLGFDEDGDAITSLTVCQLEHGIAPEHPFKVDQVQEAAHDDAFVDEWVRRLMSEGKQPTGRSLEGQLPMMKARYPISQKRLRDAVARLKGEGRLVETPGGPSGAKWLRAVDIPQGAA
jgi:hypothetical protein